MGKERSPAEQLEGFLKFIDDVTAEYKYAYDNVSQEDHRLQDLVHEMEFAVDRAERNRVATKLHNSRKQRRQNKDIVLRDELVVKFFEDQQNRAVLNKLKQLLGRQRKQEEYLASDRVYKPRAGKQ